MLTWKKQHKMENLWHRKHLAEYGKHVVFSPEGSRHVEEFARKAREVYDHNAAPHSGWMPPVASPNPGSIQKPLCFRDGGDERD